MKRIDTGQSSRGVPFCVWTRLGFFIVVVCFAMFNGTTFNTANAETYHVNDMVKKQIVVENVKMDATTENTEAVTEEKPTHMFTVDGRVPVPDNAVFCDEELTKKQIAQRVVECFNRNEIFYFKHDSTDDYYEFAKELNYIGVVGDYGLTGNYLYNTSHIRFSGAIYGTETYYTFTFLSTSNSKEKKLNKKIKKVLKSIKSKKLSTYQKIKKTHDYVAKYTKVNGYSKKISNSDHSAYGASKGKAVCQGYALYYARLLNAQGVECHVITSATHAWNLVKYKGKYYNVDVYWDDDLKGNSYDHDYFMKSDKDIKKGNSDHKRNDIYATKSFKKKYPVAKKSLKK